MQLTTAAGAVLTNLGQYPVAKEDSYEHRDGA
jgi:hypothetical protein